MESKWNNSFLFLNLFFIFYLNNNDSRVASGKLNLISIFWRVIHQKLMKNEMSGREGGDGWVRRALLTSLFMVININITIILIFPKNSIDLWCGGSLTFFPFQVLFDSPKKELISFCSRYFEICWKAPSLSVLHAIRFVFTSYLAIFMRSLWTQLL